MSYFSLLLHYYHRDIYLVNFVLGALAFDGVPSAFAFVLRTIIVPFSFSYSTNDGGECRKSVLVLGGDGPTEGPPVEIFDLPPGEMS